jgi:hypothetical protein
LSVTQRWSFCCPIPWWRNIWQRISVRLRPWLAFDKSDGPTRRFTIIRTSDECVLVFVSQLWCIANIFSLNGKIYLILLILMEIGGGVRTFFTPYPIENHYPRAWDDCLKILLHLSETILIVSMIICWHIFVYWIRALENQFNGSFQSYGRVPQVLGSTLNTQHSILNIQHSTISSIEMCL